MVPHLVACLRDLDPPVGGAEMSLMALLKGVSARGPKIDDAPIYLPCEKEESISNDLFSDNWTVSVYQSNDRGRRVEEKGVADFYREYTSIPVESLFSGAAWRLRSRSTQRPNKKLLHRHLKRRNHAFGKWLLPRLSNLKERSEIEHKRVIGVTQLDWSAGAAFAFSEVGIPWIVFVRDELQFHQPSLFRASLDGAIAVCGAGEGLLHQISDVFAPKKVVNVPLPIDFQGRFGTLDDIASIKEEGLSKRKKSNDLQTPRIAIVGVSPEKGASFYPQLLDALSETWPSAQIDVYGDGSYASSLGQHSNANWHGHASTADVFSSCDLHLLTVESTGTWGRVINEAGLFGVPTVSVDIGSQAEAVGPGGRILPQNANLDAWVSALQEVYEQRSEYGEKAKEHAGVSDHRRSIAIFRTLLHELIE